MGLGIGGIALAETAVGRTLDQSEPTDLHLQRRRALVITLVTPI